MKNTGARTNTSYEYVYANWHYDKLQKSEILFAVGPVDVSCEHGKEPSGSIKYWESLDYVSNYQLHEVDFIALSRYV